MCTPVDLRTILKDTDPINNDGYRLHLHIQWHSDGTASYEHIYLQPDGYTIEANWVE